MVAKYIAFEGIDGSGKTKQVELVANYLTKKGFKILITKEFGSPHDAACVKIREFALSSSYGFDELAGQFMFAACSTQHSAKVIAPNLNKYDFILSDRSIESNLAYCAAIGFDRNLVHTLFFLDKDRIYPDTVIYLDINPEVAWARLNARTKESFTNGGVDRIEDKGFLFQKLVREEYLRRTKENATYLTINCDNLDIEQTFLKVISNLFI